MVWDKLSFRDSNFWRQDSELVLLQLYLRTADGDVWEFPSASWHVIQRRAISSRVTKGPVNVWRSFESWMNLQGLKGLLKSAKSFEVYICFLVLLAWYIKLVEWWEGVGVTCMKICIVVCCISARDKASGCFGTTMYTRPLYRTVWTMRTADPNSGSNCFFVLRKALLIVKCAS